MTDILATSQKLARLIEERADTMEVPITLSIVDVHGNIVLKERMPGAPLISVEMSERKAYTSAAFGAATKDMTADAQPGGPLFGITAFAGGRFVAFGGGAPLLSGGVRVGGVGVSGGTTEQDIKILESALDALAKEL
jgi:uncharacterized protein GlcG (DUF336 family)